MTINIENSPTVKLYTTVGCHLCDEALVLLERLGLRVESVEIADNDDLFERYGLRIPVVTRRVDVETSDELGWPFDLDRLISWLGME